MSLVRSFLLEAVQPDDPREVSRGQPPLLRPLWQVFQEEGEHVGAQGRLHTRPTSPTQGDCWIDYRMRRSLTLHCTYCSYKIHSGDFACQMKHIRDISAIAPLNKNIFKQEKIICTLNLPEN